jgi:hypothetical protein
MVNKLNKLLKKLQIPPAPISNIQSTPIDHYKLGSEALLQGCYDKAILYLGAVSHPKALGLLGFCYEFGLGVDESFAKAEELYIQAVSGGNALAAARLSFLRKYGRPGVKIDRVEAEQWAKFVNELPSNSMQWLEIAANDYQLPAAHYAYGVCFHDGYFLFI